MVSPLANLGVLRTGLIDSAFSRLLICGALAPHPGRVLRVLLVIFVGGAIGLRWIAAWQPMTWIVGAGSLLAGITLGCFAAIVLKRVFESGPVTRHRFVTLTTVGYGDITAVHPLARTLVIAEALTGQLYPAIIIGGLVSSTLQGRSGS